MLPSPPTYGGIGRSHHSKLQNRLTYAMIIAIPRTYWASVRGYCYHVIDRGNDRVQAFHDGDQYAGFVRSLE
jgi:hypothetical protein